MPKAPAASAESLRQEAVAALDACFSTLSRIDEQLRGLLQNSEAEHQSVLRHISLIADLTRAGDSSALTPDLVMVDQEAMYNNEIALRRELMALESLQKKVGYLTNLVLDGAAGLSGRESGDVGAPWAAAVKAARIEAVEHERMRLAREVHDGPAQVLANAIIGLEYCQIVARRAPAELEAELMRLRDMIRSSLIEVRRFMFDLRPTTLATMGLNATLARYVEEFQATHDLVVELTAPAEELAIDDRAQISIFRILQEGLQNIQKHSAATHAWIELACSDDGAVRLTIRDNGQGFDPGVQKPTARSGAGLLGMRERAALLGGTLTIASQPGQGAAITLHLPATHGRSADAEQTAVAKRSNGGRRKR